MAFSCDICDREFTGNRGLTHHMENQHGNLWSCHRCSQSFNRYDNYEMHQTVCLFKTTGKRSGGHLSMVAAKKLKDNVNRVGGALDGTVNQYRLNLEVAKKRAVKFYLSLHANFPLNTDVTFLTNPPAVLSTDTMEVYGSSDVLDALNSISENLASTIEDFQQHGSGWVLDKLLALDLHLLEFDPLRSTSYIPLPTCIQNKKAVINIKNKDEKCFLWSVIGGLYGDSLPSKMIAYLITWSMRRNSTFKVFHFQWL